MYEHKISFSLKYPEKMKKLGNQKLPPKIFYLNSNSRRSWPDYIWSRLLYLCGRSIFDAHRLENFFGCVYGRSKERKVLWQHYICFHLVPLIKEELFRVKSQMRILFPDKWESFSEFLSPAKKNSSPFFF